MKIKVSDSNICVFFMTILVFLDMEPFFVWSQFSSVGYRIYMGIILITTVLMAFIVCKKKIVLGATPSLTDRNRLTLPLIMASMGIVLLFFYEVFLSGVVTTTLQPFNLAMLCIHLGLMMFSLQDNFSLRSVYLASKKIFAITLIPALIVFVLMQIGVDIPYFALDADSGKMDTGQSYQLYLGLATMLRNQGGLLNRLCGMYREPGFVGTIGALYLLGDKFTLRKWENVVILLASLCTFSLAFVILIALGLILCSLGRLQNKRKAISGVIVILAVVMGYFVFMSLPFDSGSTLGELQGRLVITEGGLAGDNRMDEYADTAYEAFLNSNLKTVLFGYGEDLRVVPGTNYSIWQNAHSYKEFVFNFGFLALIILVVSVSATVFVKYRMASKSSKWKILVLLLVFLISIYQRYSVVNFHYFCVLFGGASNLALSDS